MTKLFWLSFCDSKKPKEQQFLGACIVEVTEAEATETLTFIDVEFPHHEAGAEWVGAAGRKAHREGCNPGGEMMSLEIPPHWRLFLPPNTPRNTLMTMAEMQAMGMDPVRA